MGLLRGHAVDEAVVGFGVGGGGGDGREGGDFMAS